MRMLWFLGASYGSSVHIADFDIDLVIEANRMIAIGNTSISMRMAAKG